MIQLLPQAVFLFVILFEVNSARLSASSMRSLFFRKEGWSGMMGAPTMMQKSLSNILTSSSKSQVLSKTTRALSKNPAAFHILFDRHWAVKEEKRRIEKRSFGKVNGCFIHNFQRHQPNQSPLPFKSRHMFKSNRSNPSYLQSSPLMQYSYSHLSRKCNNLTSSNFSSSSSFNDSTKSLIDTISKSEEETIKDNNDLKPFTWKQLIQLIRPQHKQPNKNSQSTQNSSKDHVHKKQHPNLAALRRSSSTQATYRVHQEYLRNNWRSPYDYLVVSKFGKDFGFESVLVPKDSNQKTNVNDNIKQQNISNSYGMDVNNKRGKEKLLTIPPDGYLFQASPSLKEASQYAIKNGLKYLRLVPNDFPYDVGEGIEHWCLWKIGGCNAFAVESGDEAAVSSETILEEEISWALDKLEQHSTVANGGCSRIVTCGEDDDGSRGEFFDEDSLESGSSSVDTVALSLSSSSTLSSSPSMATLTASPLSNAEDAPPIPSTIAIPASASDSIKNSSSSSDTNVTHPILDRLYWVNPPHLQSMPEIIHAHILVLRCENAV